jgi:pilus assembly protein CpaF
MIVGECRGAEVLQMLQAMNSGHEGSMTTLHANSPRDALARMEMMMLLSGLELPVKALRQQIATSLNLIVQVERVQGGARRLTSISELTGMDAEVVMIHELYRYRPLGVDHQGRTYGVFEATGVRPNCEKKLKSLGLGLPSDMFQQRELARA